MDVDVHAPEKYSRFWTVYVSKDGATVVTISHRRKVKALSAAYAAFTEVSR